MCDIADQFLAPGAFELGANYWASHAGTNMWSDWREDTVEADFARLSKHGITLARVFPLWPDFQPIHAIMTGQNRPYEYRFGDQTLPDDDCGQAGVSEVMCQRFETLCTIAEKYNIRLIVALLTGWMSGRTFTPPALENMNLFTDPVAIMWESRFVGYFVERMKNQKSIAAWDLGNECNCMSGASTRAEAWSWSSTVTNAIKSQDNTRPVISGMHGLGPEGVWTIQDQAEITDVLTTHPYPAFTPHCNLEPINTLRGGILHASAESAVYADIGGVPCIVEETGTLGPMNGSPETVGQFLRPAMYSAWTQDCRALLWWCNSDFDTLSHPPYDYYMMERELGLFDRHAKPKRAAEVMLQMRQTLDSLPFGVLPARIVDAVCILTQDQDHWANAYGAYVLGKQSGVDIEYQYSTAPLKCSKVYMMPGIAGHAVMPRRRWIELQEAVRSGATLYMSFDDGCISEFEELTGLCAVSRCSRSNDITVSGKFELEELQGNTTRTNRLECKSAGAEILACDQELLPVLARHKYGNGTVYTLLTPIEKSQAISRESSASVDNSLWRCMYRLICANPEKAVANTNPAIGVTEHPVSSSETIVVAINYSSADIEWNVQLNSDWIIGKIHQNLPIIPASDAAIFEIERK